MQNSQILITKIDMISKKQFLKNIFSDVNLMFSLKMLSNKKQYYQSILNQYKNTIQWQKQ